MAAAPYVIFFIVCPPFGQSGPKTGQQLDYHTLSQQRRHLPAKKEAAVGPGTASSGTRLLPKPTAEPSDQSRFYVPRRLGSRSGGSSEVPAPNTGQNRPSGVPGQQARGAGDLDARPWQPGNLLPDTKPRPRSPGPLCVPSPQSSTARRPQAPPPLATHRRPPGGPRSRCRGSRRPARGSRAAAGLRPGRGRGSRWPAPTRRGSSTPRARGEPASSCAAARGGPESRAGGQSGAHRRPDRTRGPARSRASEPASEQSPGPSWKCLGGAHASPRLPFQILRGPWAAPKPEGPRRGRDNSTPYSTRFF
nr:PREDICTED: uncharacterized protein LOC109458774 [Rhinolophus sinicus]